MARKPRIEFDGAFYHVLVRGNQKQKIFKDNHDYSKYLELLTDYKKRYGYSLYSYVLMYNHVHLLIETQRMPLSKILQGINQSYTMYFNRKYKTVGHLFQGRYKAILCDRDDYLLTLVKYIHLNPFRAGIVQNLKSYEWSSHHEYARKTDDKGIIDTDQVLRMFSESKPKARKFYMRFIGDGVSVKKEDVYSSIDHRVIGNEEFVERIMNNYDRELLKVKEKKKYKLTAISKVVKRIYGVSLEQIRSDSRAEPISTVRRVISHIAKDQGYKGKEIAEYIGKDPAAISQYLKEKDKLIEEKKEVYQKIRSSE